MHRFPPLHWLQAFEASARTLSFTAAGQELSVTQAAISQRIRLLEDRLGQPLFVRHPRSLTLTPAGQAWLPSVQDAFARLDEGTLEVFGVTPDRSVTLRATPALQSQWLAPRLARFHRDHPEVTVRIVSAVWHSDFGAEGADIELRYGQGEWRGMEAVSLGASSLLPVCTPRLAEQLVSLDALAGQTLLHAAGFAVGWPAWLAHVGRKDLTSHCHSLICDNLSMVMALAHQGAGLALVHRCLLEDPRGLVSPFADELPSREGFWLCRPHREPGSVESERLWRWLMSEVAPGAS